MTISLLLEKPLTEELAQLIKIVERELQVTVVQAAGKGSYLKYEEQGLSLVDGDLGPLHLDFHGDAKNYSRAAHRGKSELIAKAVGLPKGIKKIFDATLGLAQDAWFLAQLGADVRGYERSPVVFLLLAEALQRSGQKNFKIHYGDSIEWIQTADLSNTAVYLDPMFPEKKKSALPRKEMQIFRKWVGADSDALVLFQSAMQSNAERVVVKRPIKAPVLADGVMHSFEGQTVRYDLYTPMRRSLA